MLQSMTGFGQSHFENEEIKIETEIKSLNSKVFDLKFKTNNLSSNHEIKLRNLLSPMLHRGKIDLILDIEIKNSLEQHKINEKIFEQYYEQIKNINNKFNQSTEKINYTEIIMSLPGIIEINNPEIDVFFDTILSSTKQAAENLIIFRKQEGKDIKNALSENTGTIENLLSQIQTLEDERIENIKNKLKQALDNNNIEINERFESEIIYYLEKFDITEEKNRLQNHLKYFLSSMNENNCGKKLNFISQEMGREINTLGAKANHFQIQKIVVAMKDELEKIKEQVLNIL